MLRRATARAPMGAAALATGGVLLIAFNLRLAVSEVPPLLPDLGLSRTSESVLVTVPVVCFAVAALGAPGLRRRLGDERALFSLLVLLVAGMLVRTAWTGWMLFAGTVMAGLAIALLNVLIPSYIKRHHPERAGEMTAAYTGALGLGAALAAGLTVPIYDAAGGSVPVALAAWAVPAVLALVIWSTQLSRQRATAPEPPAFHRRLRIWRSPVAWKVTLFMGLQSFVFYSTLSWIPVIYQDRGVDPGDAGALLMVSALTGLAASMSAPLLVRRMRDERVGMAVAVLLSVLGLLGVAFGGTVAGVPSMVIFGLGQGASISLILLAMVVRAPDADVSAHLSTMAQSGGYTLAATGPLLVGLLHAATGSWSAGLALLFVVLAAQFVSGFGAGAGLISAPEGELARSGHS